MTTMRTYRGTILEGPENFKAWMRDLKMNFEKRGLWTHLQDDYPPPEDPLKADLDDPAWERVFVRWSKWRDQENKARPLICGSISEDIRKFGLETAHDILGDLIKQFEKAPIDKFSLYQCWHGLQWDGTKLQKFLKEWDSALTNCLDAGIQISEDVKIFTFINLVKNCGIPMYAVWALTTLRGGKLSQLAEVTVDLLNFWSRFKLDEIEQAEWKDKCEVCGIKGHTPSKCWNLHPELDPQRFRPKQKLVSAFKEKMQIESEDDEKAPEVEEPYDFDYWNEFPSKMDYYLSLR